MLRVCIILYNFSSNPVTNEKPKINKLVVYVFTERGDIIINNFYNQKELTELGLKFIEY